MKKLAGYMTSLEVTIYIFQFGVGFKDFCISILKEE